MRNPKHLTLMGLDPSLAHFGIAIAIVPLGDSLPIFIHAEVAVTERDASRARKIDDVRERISLICARLVQLESLFEPDAICIEATATPFGKTSLVTVAALGRVRGLVDMLAAPRVLPVFEAGSQSLKASATGNKSATKEDMIEAVLTRYPQLRRLMPAKRSLYEHAADAAAAVHHFHPEAIELLMPKDPRATGEAYEF